MYHTTHQCFYSRRSLYLALFRLIDDIAGVNELDPWLRNVQVCVCGCGCVCGGVWVWVWVWVCVCMLVYIPCMYIYGRKHKVKYVHTLLSSFQLRASGCPVIIVGTHLDGVSETKAKELEKAASSKYADTSIYPKVVSVVSVSSTRRATVFSANNMEKLRTLIYDVACHLQLATDGVTCKFKLNQIPPPPMVLLCVLLQDT